MSKGYVLYNLKAGFETNLENVKLLENQFDNELEFINIISIEDYAEFISKLSDEDFIILCGGDGTINCFVNKTDGIEIKNQILYYPLGTGNDFAAELGFSKGSKPFEINEYIENLPTVIVKNKKYRFLNGVGYGIDGYCCEVGDELKKTSTKKINYTSIAIKGLLFYFKPKTATVTVDDKVYTFKKVWIAPTMNGKYYGGGMIPTPNQDRKNPDGTLSTMIFHGSGKLKTLMIFPSIFKGEHIKNKKFVEVLEGKKITVEFDKPSPLQIDGETILDVISYTAISAKETVKV
ncbi:MAG: diacylglycerol kinase family protein [Clostridia bacterium]|nr:diacylglycerol kinase family protein [Clostridia bacterium]